MQALDHEDILAADADQRACLVLAVFELPLLVVGKLAAELDGNLLGQGTACIEPEHQHGQFSAMPLLISACDISDRSKLTRTNSAFTSRAFVSNAPTKLAR
jgi:hypothetical protein